MIPPPHIATSQLFTESYCKAWIPNPCDSRATRPSGKAKRESSIFNQVIRGAAEELADAVDLALLSFVASQELQPVIVAGAIAHDSLEPNRDPRINRRKLEVHLLADGELDGGMHADSALVDLRTAAEDFGAMDGGLPREAHGYMEVVSAPAPQGLAEAFYQFGFGLHEVLFTTGAEGGQITNVAANPVRHRDQGTGAGTQARAARTDASTRGDGLQ